MWDTVAMITNDQYIIRKYPFRYYILYMSCCTNQKCTPCSTIVGVLSILLGIGMLWMGVPKLIAVLSGDAANLMFIGETAWSAGLSFLAQETRVWIVAIAEVLAGGLLIFGCRRSKRLGALITLVIVLVAAIVTKAGVWPAIAMDVIFGILSLIVLIRGGRTIYERMGRTCDCHGQPCSSASQSHTTDKKVEVVDA
jgi:uncharacterized membrane protein YphA (DoxX/SURF4 family)